MTHGGGGVEMTNRSDGIGKDRAQGIDPKAGRPGCAAEPLLFETVLRADPRFIGRIFSVEVQDVELADGRKTTRELVRHPGGSCVVALDDRNRLYLVRQYRVGTGGPSREIPAGKLDPDESALNCARANWKNKQS